MEWSVKNVPFPEPIIEFGALQVQTEGGPCNVRHLFPGKNYLGADMRPGPGVDRVLNLHKIDLPNSSAGTVILLDTLEHVEFPRQALAEILRILKPGGKIVMTSTMFFPIHSYPNDYWRFTPQAFESLLGEFGEKWVTFLGDPLFPYAVFGVGIKSVDKENNLESLTENFKKNFKAPPDTYQLVLSLCPPFLLNFYRRFKSKP